MPTAIEAYHQDGEWHVRRQGQEEPLSSHTTKDQAEQEGRRIATAEDAEFFIKKLDGTIGEKDSHGNDPTNIPG